MKKGCYADSRALVGSYLETIYTLLGEQQSGGMSHDPLQERLRHSEGAVPDTGSCVAFVRYQESYRILGGA
jgi:hypothetical protein